jgi:hypothetical protein
MEAGGRMGMEPAWQGCSKREGIVGKERDLMDKPGDVMRKESS